MMAADSEVDVQYMRRAIRLAMNGRGRVEPNPMVGCVIVKEGRVIGEGYHQQYGQPHAEPNALAACSESPAGATVYVTLEPCCHPNKKTPPCAPKLIEAKVGRVVVGCIDPNLNVRGAGVEKLRKAGIDVNIGVLEQSCQQLACAFMARQLEGRMYVTLKWAQTADGKIAGANGTRLQISNERSQRLVHELRSRGDAIMVGINTVLADDPLLTARGVSPVRPLVRIVLDSNLRIPLNCRLIRTLHDRPDCEVVSGLIRKANELLVYTSEAAAKGERIKVARLEELSVDVAAEPLNHDGTLPLSKIIRGMALDSHLLVEPGPTLAGRFFETGLADRVWVFRSTKRINDASAPSAWSVPGHYIETGRIDLDGDTLTEYLNPRSPVFFSAEASADLVLARGGDAP